MLPLVLTFLITAATPAQAIPPVSPPPAAPVIGNAGATPAADSGSPPHPAADAVARLLDSGIRIGNPFPGKGSVIPMSSEDNAHRAQSIIRLAAVARERGLDRSADVVRTVTALQQILLVEKLMQTLSDNILIDEHEVRARFDRYPERYDEFQLSHIFYSSAGRVGAREMAGASTNQQTALQRATDAEAKLRSGVDFADVASTMSDDGETAADGGMLPAILGVNIQPVFLDAVRTLKEGQVSGIVRGNNEYHIVKLVRRRHFYSGPARETIEQEIKAREMQKLLPELQQMEAASK